MSRCRPNWRTNEKAAQCAMLNALSSIQIERIFSIRRRTRTRTGRRIRRRDVYVCLTYFQIEKVI